MMRVVTAESPLRPITDDEVEAFRSDGVVCLRQVIPASWLDRMAEAVERALADPLTVDLSQMGVDLAAGLGTETLLDPAVGDASTPGRFRAGTQHWRRDAEFDAFARTSPLPRIVARLLASTTVQLYEDSVLVKEPGTAERTAFHQDMAYFHVEGDQVCTTWVPLDPVTSASGALEFVRGSHRWRARSVRTCSSPRRRCPTPRARTCPTPEPSATGSWCRSTPSPATSPCTTPAPSTAPAATRRRRSGAGRSPSATRVTTSGSGAAAVRPSNPTTRPCATATSSIATRSPR
jgi:hypothetical protein